MGRPPALLLLLLLLPVAPSPPSCFSVPSIPSSELDLTNSTQECSELDWGPFQGLRRLLLSHNGIGALSPSSRLGPQTEELNLSHNRLRELPPAFLGQARGLQHLHLQHNQLRDLPNGFFSNATSLRSLRLQGNPLPAVPPSAFQPTLRLLELSCGCPVVSTALAPCSRSNGTGLRCHCLTTRYGLVNITHFHSQECWGNVSLVAGLAGVVGGLVVLVVLVVLGVLGVVRYRRRRAAGAGGGWGKWEPAAAHGQPRYISRDPEVGTAEAAAAPDYENIFVSPGAAPGTARGWTPGWQEHSPPDPQDDGDYFLRSETFPGDQPIYANTQNPDGDNYYSH
ncbi:leucine-rich repeat-containing protein 25 [Apus apus]|uniref:leucine-rich repeat-containing protein 25 n=1 Tax=Apus apus TaxID=8895 RepID=UPI0021F8B4D3|nr:leucine-rich repeat-containing protein 25 [Apus apus]